MDKMSTSEEQRIYGALEKAIGMVNGGTHPNDAICKVAEEHKFMPQVVGRMIEAYNVSKTLSHMKHASAGARAESFPLADTQTVLERMYPAKPIAPAIKAAAYRVADSYSFNESINFNKVAASFLIPLQGLKPHPGDPSVLAHQKWDKHAGLRKNAEYARGTYRSQLDKIMGMAKEAGQYFWFSGHTPFAEIESQVIRSHGSLGKAAMDLVHRIGDVRDARSDEKPWNGTGMAKSAWYRATEKPYAGILELIAAGTEFHKLATRAAKAQDELSAFENETNTHFRPSIEKNACLLDGIVGNAGGQVKEALADIANTLQQAGSLGLNIAGLNPNKSEDSVRRTALGEVLDPTHESKLQGMKMQAVLNDFLSNDPVLSTYEPHHVTNAYNQLAELAPHVAQQPAVVRGMLRRMLQQEGVVEPFEAQQVTGIERHLRGLAPDNTMAPAAPGK